MHQVPSFIHGLYFTIGCSNTRRWLIQYPNVLFTKLRARFGQVRKFIIVCMRMMRVLSTSCTYQGVCNSFFAKSSVTEEVVFHFSITCITIFISSLKTFQNSLIGIQIKTLEKGKKCLLEVNVYWFELLVHAM